MKVARRSATSSRDPRLLSESYLLYVLIHASEIRSECHRRLSPTMRVKEKATIDEGGEEISDEFEGIRTV
ncbi:hypothetical protein TIFTF001_034316 [Ficus carica]|uniref:Uncharacterized protein n=1 Tax=Ficus carica TaxID=3494 RepID=A0AA88J8E2_FICCA|nr:hypothetical protein TIFTF001_034316 [Ficus carica]